MNTKLYNSIIEIVKNHYNNSKLIIPPNNKLVFLCGGNSEYNVRPKLIEYLQKYHNESYDYLLAEEINKIIPEKDDLLTQENILADYSDCIIIILESYSSSSELGAFVNYDDKRKNSLIEKILILNTEEHKDAPSFINKGPIKKALNKSKFKKVFYYKDSETCLELSEELLEYMKQILPTNNRYDNFSNLNNLIISNNSHNPKKIILHLIIDLVRLTGPIEKKVLFNITRKIIGKNIIRANIEEVIGILYVLKYIDKIPYEEDNPYLICGYKNNPFLLDKRYLNDRVKIINLYKKFDKERMRKFNEYYNPYNKCFK